MKARTVVFFMLGALFGGEVLFAFHISRKMDNLQDQMKGFTQDLKTRDAKVQEWAHRFNAKPEGSVHAPVTWTPGDSHENARIP
jgi:hypothetical protein